MRKSPVMALAGDAFHVTSPCEDGSGAAKAMELAMQEGAFCHRR